MRKIWTLFLLVLLLLPARALADGPALTEEQRQVITTVANEMSQVLNQSDRDRWKQIAVPPALDQGLQALDLHTFAVVFGAAGQAQNIQADDTHFAFDLPVHYTRMTVSTSGSESLTTSFVAHFGLQRQAAGEPWMVAETNIFADVDLPGWVWPLIIFTPLVSIHVLLAAVGTVLALSWAPVGTRAGWLLRIWLLPCAGFIWFLLRRPRLQPTPPAGDGAPPQA